MLILVIGSALRAVSDAQDRLGLRFVEAVRTAPRYRLWTVDDAFAALVEVDSGGVAVAGELVEAPDALLEAILASEPSGVTQSPVKLEDGRWVSAATADPQVIGERGRDISRWGSFAAFLQSERGTGQA